VQLRQATTSEIENDEKLIYQNRDRNSWVEVNIVGFVPVRDSQCQDTTLCVLEKWNGTIILARDDQLFVEIDS